MSALPPPADPDAAARGLADLAHLLPDWQPEDDARAVLAGVFGASPYLTSLTLRHPTLAHAVLTGTADGPLEAIIAELRAADADEDALRRALRIAKQKAALLIGLADLSGQWSVDAVTAALTRFADAALGVAVDFLIIDAARSGKLRNINPAAPSQGCGYAVLAMGKHGAGELNYSSDIDLIVLYDAASPHLAEGVDPATVFVRLTKQLVSLMQEPDGDGYCFRVDLRLRPDPRATQIAISIEAAAVYYENLGQNWERAAMIKARAAAGDIALGEEFLDRLTPYIWRKYLDFAAIADVQSLKRQIHAVKGHGSVAARGHNIKLGRGGIREIEFFVQTQQLIAGGRNRNLRGRRTLDMLAELARADWITTQTAEEMTRDYRFLRMVEHRIQMVLDEQTHLIPADTAAFARLARFCGFSRAEDFEAALLASFTRVQGHYSRLFEDAGALGGEAGSLVFTGGEDDPETLETLTRMGYRAAGEVSATIRGWHFGRYGATRSGRARELLTEIMPALLAALAHAGDAMHAFMAFDRFLSRLPAGVQLFSLLKANPNLLELLATVLGTAPRLAEQLSSRPKVLDAVLDPGFFERMPDRAELDQRIAEQIPPETPLEEALDRARIIGKEQMFRIGLRVISETVSAGEAGLAWSALADALIARLFAGVEADLIARHGRPAGGEAALIAMGKLGSREMTATSDIDLILIYDTASDAEMTDGPKPVSVNQFYTRLTQRLIAALSAPTAEGGLYEVDMRLRPSGNKGPVATRLESFVTYHQGSAWTWEKLALTRARLITGAPTLSLKVGAAITAALTSPRDSEAAREDVRVMRGLMLKEFPSRPLWDLKHARGGLVDLEFIVQYLQIRHAPSQPGVLAESTAAGIARLAEHGKLTGSEARILTDALRLYARITQILRLSVSGQYDPALAPAGLNRLVASAAGTPDIVTAEALLAETGAEVAEMFNRLIGLP